MNDPSGGHEPFTELEYQLLRLSMLTVKKKKKKLKIRKLGLLLFCSFFPLPSLPLPLLCSLFFSYLWKKVACFFFLCLFVLLPPLWVEFLVPAPCSSSPFYFIFFFSEHQFLVFAYCYIFLLIVIYF